MLKIAFDIGGTFTDFVLHEPATGRTRFWKSLSTPAEPSRGALSGLQALLQAEKAEPSAVKQILHATTVAANALIEQKGSRIALITTAGLRDIVVMGRQKRHDTYDVYAKMPVQLVARKDIYEVSERVNAAGEVVDALREQSVLDIVPALKAGGYEAVAICFMHSYANPSHERRVQKLLEPLLPDTAIVISSKISPKIREYERLSTTVANAYVLPIVQNYLQALQEKLVELGVSAPLSVMQSSGAMVTPSLAKRYPIRIVESGPAAGVLMCAEVGRQEGFDHVLTFDMGGTTAKLGAVDKGEPAITATFEIAREKHREGAGLPLNIPSVELIEIGAGGGSIPTAELGIIRVGPESAGADPGPACYGRGGERPTVTDANLVLGYLDAQNFNAGAMSLDRAKSVEAIRLHVAEPLGISVEEAAWGIHRIASSNMERAMRIVSVERGRNPHDYALVAFGGAGPLHAARLARSLGIPTLIVPAGAGVGSALGLLAARSKVDASMTRILEIDRQSSGEIGRIYDELMERVSPDVERLGLDRSKVTTSRYAYMRYRGQGHERKIDLPDGPIDEHYAQRILDRFNDEYRKNYGYLDSLAVVECVDWYLVVSDGSERAPIVIDSPSSRRAAGERSAYFPENGGYAPCPVFDRYALTVGQRVSGPAIVEENETSTIILPGDSAEISANGSLIVKIKLD